MPTHISITCRKCFKSFKVDARFAGKKGRCPNPECKAVFRVPSPVVSTEAVPERFESGGIPAVLPRRTKNKARKKQRSGKRNKTQSRGVWVSLGVGGGTLFALAIAVILLTGGKTPEAASKALAKAPPVPEKPQPTETERMGELGLEPVRRIEPIAMKDDTGFPNIVKPYLEKYCVDCHSGDTAMAGIGLDEYANKFAVLEDRKNWEKVFGMLKIGAMPPKDAFPQPSDKERQKVVAWVDDALHNIDCNQIDDPGRVTVQRLNATEYNNTIHDLFGIDLSPANNFPADDVGEGFDNIGDVLSLPPLLMEKYLDAARSVADAVVVDTFVTPVVRKRGRDFKTKGSADARRREVSFPSRGVATATFEIPVKGTYTLRVRAEATQGGDELTKMNIAVDDIPLKTVEVPGHHEPKTFEFEIPMLAGKSPVSIEFPNDFYDPDNKDARKRDRNLTLEYVEIEGPKGGTKIDPPEPHKRVVVAEPGPKKNARQAAHEVFAKLLPRVYRRPVEENEIARLADLTQQTVADGGSYEDGLRLGIQAALVSPSFLFRIESDPRPDNADYSRKLKDYEIASRLSYFLWSSMPDEELFRLADEGKLSQPSVLEKQARRMLADPKSEALVKNFGGQWLNLRNLDDIDFSRRRFREFNNDLRRDMVTETLTFFGHIVHEDGNLLDLLDGKYTFVNERLAKLYGIKDVKGEEFRKVSLEGTPRAGVLTQASILALTSNPTRTSPVKRGKWIMENILGTPPPPPPPNVPAFEEAEKASPDATLAQQLALHRADAGCASCHDQMDPLGLAFEKFNAIGEFRERDGRNPIDDSGVLPGGRTFHGPGELIAILKERQRDFVTNFTEKMLTYALGRGLKYYDQCAVDQIVDAVEQDHYRFSRLIVELVQTDPFLRKRGDGGIE